MNLSFINKLPDRVISIDYMPFWVETLTEAMKLLGPETDSDLERLNQRLRDYWSGANTDPKSVDSISREVAELRGWGSDFWRDTAPLACKYRCLRRLGFSRERYSADVVCSEEGIPYAIEDRCYAGIMYTLADINPHEDARIDQALMALAEEKAAKYGIDLWTEEFSE